MIKLRKLNLKKKYFSNNNNFNQLKFQISSLMINKKRISKENIKGNLQTNKRKMMKNFIKVAK